MENDRTKAIYVGKSPGGVVWFARDNRAGSAEENFPRMKQRLDQLWKSHEVAVERARIAREQRIKELRSWER